MSRFEDNDSQGERPRSRFGGGNSGGSRFGGGSRGGFGGGRSGGFGNRPQRSFNDGPREMHKAVCSECKKECEVPFRPTEGKPVYCSDCFKNHRKF